MSIQLHEECNVSLSPGDGDSDSLRLLQQPTGVSRGGKDQERPGCYFDDGSHQYASCTEHDCTVQPRGEVFICVTSQELDWNLLPHSHDLAPSHFHMYGSVKDYLHISI